MCPSGLAPGFSSQSAAPPFLTGATIDMNFKAGAYLGRTPAGLTVTRASVGNAADASGNWKSFATNVPRITSRGMLVEEARTNAIRNNSMQGAVVGSPGTLPTNWSYNPAITGVTCSVVGLGTESGIDYIDLRFNGVASGVGNLNVAFDNNFTIAGTNNQVWASSAFITRSGGSNTNIAAGGFSLFLDMFAAGSSYLSTVVPIAGITPAAGVLGQNRISGVVLLNQPTSATLNTYLSLAIAAAGAVDITVRIGWPQLELTPSTVAANDFATSPIRTTGSAVARSPDAVTLTSPPGFGAAYSMYAQGTPQAPAAYGAAQNLLELSAGSSNRVILRRQAASGHNLFAGVGGTGWSNEPATVFATGVSTKWSSAQAAADQSSATGGTLQTPQTAALLPTTPTTVNIGNDVVGGEQWNGYVERIALWPTARVANAQLQAMTLNAPYVVANIEASNYIARMAATPSDANKIAIDAFFGAIKNGAISGTNIYLLLDEFWLYANQDSQSALLGAKNQSNSTVVGTPVFTTNVGFTGNPAGSYLNTNRNVNVGVNFTQSSASFGAYVINSIITDSNVMGDNGGENGITARRFSGGASLMSVNDFTVMSIAGSVTSVGFWAANRSGGAARQFYHNGVSIGSDAQASVGTTGNPFLVSTSNAFPDAYQIGFAFIGGTLTANQQLDLYNAVQAYLHALGAV
jgi:hypothetical protein